MDDKLLPLLVFY